MPIDPARPQSAPVAASTIRRRKRPRTLYLGLFLLMTAFVAAGFWLHPGPLRRDAPPVRPAVVHLYAAVFLGWIALVFVQVGLVIGRRKDLHKRLGNYVTAYGAVLLGVGLVAAVAGPVLNVRAGEMTPDQAVDVLLWPLGDLVLFASFFIPGYVYRDNHGWHKRLMVLATLALAFPGAARLVDPLAHPILFPFVWLSPLVVAMAVDLATIRRVHPAYLLGLPVTLLLYARLLLLDSAVWSAIGRSILAPFLGA